VSFDLISLVLQAGLIVKLVLLLLLMFSLTSLTIIVVKWRELRAADQDSEAFLEVYQRDGFSEAYDAARHLDRSPLAVVFLTTGQSLQEARERNATDSARGSMITELERSISWGANTQARRLERGMPFLATTGSTAPFIGLFGTVIGIIGSFQVFNQAYIMTGGGPDNSTLFYVLYLYNKAFQDFQMGYASALAWILFVIIMIFTMMVVRSAGLWVYYEGER